MKHYFSGIAVWLLSLMLVHGGGHWAGPIPTPNAVTVGHMQLLTDGTVLCNSAGGSNWFRLKPGSAGGYTNGTWGNFVNGIWSTNASVAPMHDGRCYFGSAVLRDGRLIIAGGEYGAYEKCVTNYPNQRQTSEMFDPVANTWTKIPVPADIATALEFDVSSDAPQWGAGVVVYDGGFVEPSAMLLPNGDWLVAPAYVGQTLIYNVTSNVWQMGPAHLSNNDSLNETDWVKLPDDSILTIDKDSTPNTAERYIPELNRWIRDADPIAQIAYLNEYGPAILLADGKALFMGANGTNLYYTPSGSTNVGTWTLAPKSPGNLVANDNPAVSLTSGRVLTVLSPINLTYDKGHGSHQFEFVEFDPVQKQWNSIPAPSGCETNEITDPTSMLALPDGTALFSDSITPRLYVFVPDDPPLAAGKPTLLNITAAADQTRYHITGKLLNGLNTGAVYGDEGQMDSNFPIIRLKNGANVFYCRTVNRSSTGVMTGDAILSADFTLPLQLPTAVYSLSVVANGIASDPISFNGPAWVDFNYSSQSPQTGTFDNPFSTLAQATSAVSAGGAIFLKPGTSAETGTLSKPMEFRAAGGTVTIGSGH